MDWKEFLAWAIPLIASCVITTVIGFLLKQHLTNYFKNIDDARKTKEEKENADKAELEQYRKEHESNDLANLIAEAVKQANAPIIAKIEDIDEKLEQDREATIIVLRSKMKTLRDQYKHQGYADGGDKATWNQLYTNYQAMGGNYFKEFVNEWKKEVNELPYELEEKEAKNLPVYNFVRPAAIRPAARQLSNIKKEHSKESIEIK